MEKLRQASQKPINNLPISIERQVDFIRAILILVGIILGNSVTQWCFMLDVIVGLELLVSSLAEESFLFKLFSLFIWNKSHK